MSSVNLTLLIINTYELHGEHITTVTVTAPPPPARDDDEFADWAYDHIYSETGVGFEDGDSWYEVMITDSSDPTLVGLTFDWGY